MNLTNFVHDILIPSGWVSLGITWALGAFVYLQNSRHSLNRFFGIFAFSIGCWSIGSSLENVITNEALALRVLRLCYISASFLPTFFLHFTFVLTRQPSRRKMLCAAYVLSGLFALCTFTKLFIQALRIIEPYGFRISDPGPVYGAFVVFFAVCLGYGLWLMYRSIQRTVGIQQRQMQYIFLSHLIAVAAGVEYFSRVFRVVDFPPLDDYILVIYFAVFAYAIAKHHLLDIHVVIRRSVVYSVLVACITAAYFVMVLVMERGFQGFFGYRSFFATAFVAFLIAIFFNPIRSQIQAFVDRALFKATPEELAVQREQLLVEVRKSDQMKAVATLASGLAHEIKNPLASIKTFTEHLETRYNDPDFRAKFTRIVGGEVERINLIVQHLLQFAKPVPPKLAPLEIPRVVDETLELLNSELLQRHVEVSRHYEGAAKILADPQQLKQVFLNLFLNSLDAMNGNGRLDIRTEVRGAELLVMIADSGQGIAPKDLPHVFEPFYTTKSTGTGLGLAVVHGIVKEHGGRIDIASHVGQGTTIELSLPVAAG